MNHAQVGAFIELKAELQNSLEQFRCLRSLTVTMPSFVKRLLPILAFLAIGMAQARGMQQGFWCDCNGAIVELAAEHCHSLETSSSTFVPCDELKCSGSNSSDKDAEHHAPASVELKSNISSLGSVTIPSFVAIYLADVPSFEWLMVQLKEEAEVSLNDIPLDSGDGHLCSVQVSKCMVLLV